MLSSRELRMTSADPEDIQFSRGEKMQQGNRSAIRMCIRRRCRELVTNTATEIA